MTLLNPRVDIAFKIIFGSEENKDILLSFINSVVSLEDQVVSIELLNPYNSRNFQDSKGSILDIKAKGTNGLYFDIEVQISDEGDYDKRALFYWSKLYADQLRSGDPYNALNKAIGIHILNFDCIPNNKEYYNEWRIKEQKSGQHYFEDFAIYTIELNKFTHGASEELEDMLPRIKTGLDRWSAFLTRAHSLNRKHLPKEIDDPCILDALNALEVLSLNEQERLVYENHLKWFRTEASTIKKAEEKAEAKGIAKGIAKGRAEGELQTKKQMVLSMKENGLSSEQIAMYTDLSLAEVKDLANHTSEL